MLGVKIINQHAANETTDGVLGGSHQRPAGGNFVALTPLILSSLHKEADTSPSNESRAFYSPVQLSYSNHPSPWDSAERQQIFCQQGAILEELVYLSNLWP